jgi:hypothetical protein
VISLLSGLRNPSDPRRVSIHIHPDVRERLHHLLFEPEMRTVGYSAFINRACEAAETEIAERRSK